MSSRPFCRRCGREFADKLVNTSQGIAYDKCWGKKCPDCGRIRKLGRVIGKSSFYGEQICGRCKRLTRSVRNEICPNCFLEVEEEKNSCVCIFQNAVSNGIYCSLCKEVHDWKPCCEKCINEVRVLSPIGRNLLSPWRLIVPSVIGGTFIGIIIGIMFGRMWKNKKN